MDYASFFGDLFDLALSWGWFFLGVFLAVQVAVVGLRAVRLGLWASQIMMVAFFTLGVAGVIGAFYAWARAVGVIPVIYGMGSAP